MMRLTRQGPRWWTAWVPLLLVAGSLALEPRILLSPGEHQIVRLAMTLLALNRSLRSGKIPSSPTIPTSYSSSGPP